MKKKISCILLILTMIAMAGITGYAFFDQKTVSESEQRELTKCPDLSLDSWLDASFQGQLELFLGDHVWKRDSLISIAQRMEDYLRLPGKSLILKDVTAEDDGQTNNETEVVVLSDRIVPLYSHNDDNLVYFYESSNQLLQMIPDDIHKYFMIPPGRIEYEEESVKSLSGTAEYDAEIVYENMDDSVTSVPVFDALREGLKEHDINELYYRTDHHWSQLGAYYAAQEFLKAAGKPAINLEDYECKQGYDFQGYLTVKYNKENVIPSDSFYYYIPKDGSNCSTKVYWKDEETGEIVLREGVAIDPYRGGYYTFIEKSQFAYAVVDGAKSDGSTLLLVADSYGLGLSAWLMEEYDTVIIVDPRYYEGVDIQFYELLSEYQVTDFLLCLQSEEMRVNLFNIKMMENLLGVK